MPLKKLLLECQSTAQPPTFPLSSHLVLPFQRFLKYHLLLKVSVKLLFKSRPILTVPGVCAINLTDPLIIVTTEL